MDSINSTSRDNQRVVDRVVENNVRLRNASMSGETPEMVALAQGVASINRKKVKCPKRQLKLLHRATRNI